MKATKCKHLNGSYIELPVTNVSFWLENGKITDGPFAETGAASQARVVCHDCGFSKVYHINHAPLWVKNLHMQSLEYRRKAAMQC